MKFSRSILNLFLILGMIFFPIMTGSAIQTVRYVSLNGTWEMGSGRIYREEVTVPGIHSDPTMMNSETVWYRREVLLPEGSWVYATLELKGARFSPEVYVNGVSVSRQNGGMAPTFHLLRHRDVKPGKKITIEIALKSLKDISGSDASYIPVADQWRSNISSSLWSDVVLKVHGNRRIDKIIPYTDFKNQKADFKIYTTSPGASGREELKGRVEILDTCGRLILFREGVVTRQPSVISVPYGDLLKSWSPEHPNMYRVKLSLIDGKDTVDQSIISYGVRDFRVREKQFYLNNEHITLLGGTVVWHRWVRDEEARKLAYDTEWFTRNVIIRSKEHGANYLRFHLGVPPEAFLDLCDKFGLCVQFEWSFFHGMPASKESLLEQFPKWFDLAMRHPSVVLFHPYNETEGDQLNVVWDALDEIIKEYPPLVLEERDVIHIHKYWWSLFENLGLYYDSYDQFPKAIMVDEFGGNYLDGEGMPGGYRTCIETFLRFLGRENTKESRLELHTLANGKVAEYWRRIGAAGASPFCILGSRNDGSHWFLGNLAEGNPKPVWNALTCAWSPRSVSLDIWDRNYIPGQQLSLPLYIFNDTPAEEDFNIRLMICNRDGKIFYDRFLTYRDIQSFSTKVVSEELVLPSVPGRYTISAELINRPDAVKYPVVSQWEIHVFKPSLPGLLQRGDITAGADDPEIIKFLSDWKIRTVPVSDSSAKMILFSKNGWDRIAGGDKITSEIIERAIRRGTSVILLDAGDRYLGQGYPADKNNLGPLQGVAANPGTPAKTYNLFGGIVLSFSEAAEPESHIHPDRDNPYLWNNIPLDYTWLWNGMRGGLIVPATNFEFRGLSPSAFLSQWLPRGADESKIKEEKYFAYSLEGFYEFSDSQNDNRVREKLKNKVAFLVEDAPSLASSLNPLAPVVVTDLSKEYKDSKDGIVESLIPLICAGKNLTRTTSVMMSFGNGKGNLVVSQLLTAGRLASGFGEEDFYGVRYDPVANQLVLNMMELVLKQQKSK